MSISGAIFTDRFVSQRLTDYVYLGAVGMADFSSRLYEIAKLLQVLKVCITELREFYSTLLPNPSRPASLASRRTGNRTAKANSQEEVMPSPHFVQFTSVDGKSVTLRYDGRLLPTCTNKAVFKAFAQISDDGTSETPVVVKFTSRYGREGHELLQQSHELLQEGLAPKLWFCEEVDDVGMYVVVMDFVAGTSAEAPLPLAARETLEAAIALLHSKNLVFGDLREQNIILREGSDKAMLIDFDWCGKVGRATYPLDISDDLGWHKGVQCGGLIRPEHDNYMLQRLIAGDVDDYAEES